MNMNLKINFNCSVILKIRSWCYRYTHVVNLLPEVNLCKMPETSYVIWKIMIGFSSRIQRSIFSSGARFWCHCNDIYCKNIFHTASVHPAIMGTWCTGPRLDQ